jgi:hypothetical protein
MVFVCEGVVSVGLLEVCAARREVLGSAMGYTQLFGFGELVRKVDDRA